MTSQPIYSLTDTNYYMWLLFCDQIVRMLWTTSLWRLKPRVPTRRWLIVKRELFSGIIKLNADIKIKLKNLLVDPCNSAHHIDMALSLFYAERSRADQTPTTEKVRSSNVRSACHFGGRWQLVVLQLVTTPDLVWPYVFQCQLKFQGQGRRDPHTPVAGPNGFSQKLMRIWRHYFVRIVSNFDPF